MFMCVCVLRIRWAFIVYRVLVLASVFCFDLLAGMFSFDGGCVVCGLCL